MQIKTKQGSDSNELLKCTQIQAKEKKDAEAHQFDLIQIMGDLHYARKPLNRSYSQGQLTIHWNGGRTPFFKTSLKTEEIIFKYKNVPTSQATLNNTGVLHILLLNSHASLHNREQ